MGPLQTWKQDGRPLGPHAAVRESETGEQAGTHRRSSERRPEQPRTHPAPRGRVWAGTSNAPRAGTRTWSPSRKQPLEAE